MEALMRGEGEEIDMWGEPGVDEEDEDSNEAIRVRVRVRVKGWC